MTPSERALHVIVVNAHRDAETRDADIFLNRNSTLTGWAEALADTGAQVVVCQRFHKNLERSRNGVRYCFVAGRAHGLIRGVASVSDRAVALAKELGERGDVAVHVNGLMHPGVVRRLAQRLPRAAALVVQHRAGRPGSPFRRALQRRAFRNVDGYLFAHRDLARPWQDARVVSPRSDVHEVPATSSSLTPLSQDEARRQHGISGSPVVLWASRLHPETDPVTVIKGFELFSRTHPKARLYMAFRSDQLKDEVESSCRQTPVLERAVSLLGERPYSNMPALFSAADIFVQGNPHDTNGRTVLDAMSCGAVPVVTRIPTFQAMLGDTDGEPEVGAMWEPGNAEGCARALSKMAERPLRDERIRARRRFDEKWSWPAIGREAVAAYRSALERRRRLNSGAAIALADFAT